MKFITLDTKPFSAFRYSKHSYFKSYICYHFYTFDDLMNQYTAFVITIYDKIIEYVKKLMNHMSCKLDMIFVYIIRNDLPNAR